MRKILRILPLVFFWPTYFPSLKSLWTENCFCLVLECTIKNTRFQSLRSLGLKLKILQTFKVVLCYWPSRDVTLLPWVYLRCDISCWQVREYVRKHVQRLQTKQILRISADFRPRCLFSFLFAILQERLWHQSDVRSWYHVVFWPRDSNTIFEGKQAWIWRLIKSSILGLDFSNFETCIFKGKL